MLKRFLGGTNFYQKFIHHYSHISHPLYLTSSAKIIQLASKAQYRIRKDKEALCMWPILALPNLEKTFEGEPEVSHYVLRVILKQQWTLITYDKMNYRIYDEEFHALVQSLNHWPHFRWDNKSSFLQITNPYKFSVQDLGELRDEITCNLHCKQGSRSP
jgi:hypothetical protein